MLSSTLNNFYFILNIFSLSIMKETKLPVPYRVLTGRKTFISNKFYKFLYIKKAAIISAILKRTKFGEEVLLCEHKAKMWLINSRPSSIKIFTNISYCGYLRIVEYLDRIWEMIPSPMGREKKNDLF